MAAVLVGSFSCPIANSFAAQQQLITTFIPPKPVMEKATFKSTVEKKVHNTGKQWIDKINNQRLEAQTMMRQEEAQRQRAFALLDETCYQLEMSRPLREVVVVKGRTIYKNYTYGDVRPVNKPSPRFYRGRNYKHEEPERIISTIDAKFQELEVVELKEKPQRPEKSAKRIKTQTLRRVMLNGEQLSNLYNQLWKTLKKTSMEIEVIDRRQHKLRGWFEGKEQKQFKIILAHERGVLKKQEIVLGPQLEEIIDSMHLGAKWKRLINGDSLTHGSSGYVIPMEKLAGKFTPSNGKYFIVRGRKEGSLLDAQSVFTRNEINEIDHYSDLHERFWESFGGEFQLSRSDKPNHTCTATFDIETCGKTAAIVYQALMRSWNIACGDCATRVANMSDEEFIATITAFAVEKLKQNADDEELSPHIASVLEKLPRLLPQRNESFDKFAEIRKLIGDQVQDPLNHINYINEVLIRAHEASKNELAMATEKLLELARWHSRRLDEVRAGTYKNFKNKFSGKAHMNMSLTCDNQRDTNGNFVWGKRGHHAKRFFNQYFEPVVPEGGYERHIIRRGPNGERKLAIGNLIVSLDFETLRIQMAGDKVELKEIGADCVSVLNGNYVYPCCCVTHDNGLALTSEVIMPTKHHLVIGNTGDQKYVDLPSNPKEEMYIVKEGFCYINIYLAMLVNVKEESAKSFTKMVRDKVIRKLGKWPKLIDVATACYLLTVCYPETLDAELPRILVDHANKTMHVIDSYGSMSTGFHILKANTVSQLIRFASDPLQSQMKNYLVGGTNENSEEIQKSLKLVIRGIYRKEVMEKVLMDEPYLLLMSLLSPGVLLALYNSGSLEKALQIWIRRDQGVCVMLTQLMTLAGKVSVSRQLQDQLHVIENNAGILLELFTLTHGSRVVHPLAVQILEQISARAETDSELFKLGYVTRQEKLQYVMEKKYLEDMEQSWQELSLRGKFSAMRESHKWRKSFSAPMQPTKTADLQGKYDISFGTLRDKAKIRLQLLGKKCVDKVKEKIVAVRDKIFNATLRIATMCLPDMVKLVNVLVVISFLLTIANRAMSLVGKHRKMREELESNRADKIGEKLYNAYNEMKPTGGLLPSTDEYLEFIEDRYPEILADAKYFLRDVVEHQAKGYHSIRLEQIGAFLALLAMMFDAEKSDCIYKILMKVKSLVGTADQTVYHQSLDEIQTTLEDKNLTIDFTLATNEVMSGVTFDTTFKAWWQTQLEANRVIPHYRSIGEFREFTRKSAAALCNEISHGSIQEYIIRGAVGSGKSTGIPFHLSTKGQVLVVESTRPLAENVCKQLRGSPFNVNPTLRMRGLSSFGSTPITIMTSGFALHFFANNALKIADYKYIVLDESHVLDSSTMAFYSLLREYSFEGKILKVSATPAGRECEFEPQFTVSVAKEDSLSFAAFVQAQGTGSNADVIQKGNNILIYVASYNEVDMLSKLLLEKGFRVTKVDGRTMKTGEVEILTCGTEMKKHFVVATNIIENGVTLDIEVVVDFGMKVVAELDSDNRMVTYAKKSISYGERLQRIGRVGRVKPGHVLRINATEKGLTEIPQMVATEAAFLCFAYGLPVMTHNVTTNLLSECTVKQARTMMQFEVSPFFMFELVKFDGTMHPTIHGALKRFKLRDSEIILSKTSIPNSGVCRWLAVSEYKKLGVRLELEAGVKIPFYINGLPEKLLEEIWDIVRINSGDAGIGKLSSASACSIAYTLSKDIHALPRTTKILDELIQEEMIKQSHFQATNSNVCNSSSFTLLGIVNKIRNRFMVDYSANNIAILQSEKSQLVEIKNLNIDLSVPELLRGFPALENVRYQSKDEVAKHIGLRGRWNKSLITNDLLISGFVLFGGAWMIYKWVFEATQEAVTHQGMNKRQRQKLKFRNTRDEKLGREIYGDDGTIEHYFGDAYTKKEKKSGKKRGMGVKLRKFVNMYGFDPTEYTLVRFLDPLTGATIDENPFTDINLVQEYFGSIRAKLIESDELDRERIVNQPGIRAYYMKNAATHALKVDLTPHNPLLMCNKANTIAGFPEREFELRQTGRHVTVPFESVPKPNEGDIEVVDHESKSLSRGMRDYNPIATTICKLTNECAGKDKSLYGIGFGSVIITNRHLFTENTGSLRVFSHHGEFVVHEIKTLQFYPVVDRDIVLVQMPKDFPPFPQRTSFRQPVSEEKVCLVGSIFNTNRISSTVSETSLILPKENCNFWKHWISTKDGQCGLPLVSTKDGAVVGIHSLANNTNTINYFTSIPEDFVAKMLKTPKMVEWSSDWVYNDKAISWGNLQLHANKPVGLFKVCKLISDLQAEEVYAQSSERKWLADNLTGNLKYVANYPGQLVTKHVVNGPCTLFSIYLQTHETAKTFFEPLMGQFQKSRLNREAYIKDIMKYSSEIVVGEVNSEAFERAGKRVRRMLHEINFGECEYVTDAEAIFQALNMKSAVGALYTGKKKDYFKDYTIEDKEEILKQSCGRLFEGKMGVWSGSLKAELRPLEKTEQNKTRTFTAAPLDTLLGGKVCVDDFNNRFYDLNMVGPWTVGMTKFYGGWDKLLRKLPEGWIYCDADGSQFDSSLSPYIINAVLKLRIDFMEDWNLGKEMLRNLYTEIIYTPIATPDGSIIKKYKGNNSGQPSTVVDNTLMVIFAMQYAFEQMGISYEKQKEICVYFANGDDLMIAIEPNFEIVLDKLGIHFLNLGLKYDFTSRTRKREDLWFMSHQGKLIGEMYIPKLQEERVVSILEWDRSEKPEHRLEAICAAQIEAWGHTELLHEIRKFYSWMLEQTPYKELAEIGKAPYVSETALKRLYTDCEVTEVELAKYINTFPEFGFEDFDEDCEVYHQSTSEVQEQFDAGRASDSGRQKEKEKDKNTRDKDKDVDAGALGNYTVPRLKSTSGKMRMPMVKGKKVMNLEHLMGYEPDQVDLSNTRSTHAQFEEWVKGVQEDYELGEHELQVVLNGLMVWCIENGTSPSLTGNWVMMDGEEQVEFPIAPLLARAKPTFRQIMAHFSDVAEAYIEKRNWTKPYMPRYGIQRNLIDMSLARYAYDFYELTSKTPARAREAHIQMKAAALRNTTTRLFGLDGRVGNKEENTERHTADDVNSTMHTLMGVRNM